MTHGSDLRDFYFKKLYFGKPRDSFSKWTLQWIKDKNYIPSNLNQLLPQRLYCHLSDKTNRKKKFKNTYQARIIFQVTIFPSFGEHMWIYLWKNPNILSNNKSIKTVIELEKKNKFGELTLSEFSTYGNCSNRGNAEGQTFRSVE